MLARTGKPPALPERLSKFDFYGGLEMGAAFGVIDSGLPPSPQSSPSGRGGHEEYGVKTFLVQAMAAARSIRDAFTRRVSFP